MELRRPERCASRSGEQRKAARTAAVNGANGCIAAAGAVGLFLAFKPHRGFQALAEAAQKGPVAYQMEHWAGDR